jgi:hypothetical protein
VRNAHHETHPSHDHRHIGCAGSGRWLRPYRIGAFQQQVRDVIFANGFG